MTKSLGRTYSLLNFSGREMHYWPGNLPRRRVCVMSLGMSCIRMMLSRCYIRLFSRISKKNAQTCTTPLAPLLISPPFSGISFRVVMLTLLAALARAGDIRSHVRKVVPADDNVTERGMQEILTTRFVHKRILARNREKKLNICDIAV